MKKIGTSETGIIAELSGEEFEAFSVADPVLIKKFMAFKEDISGSSSAVIHFPKCADKPKKLRVKKHKHEGVGKASIEKAGTAVHQKKSMVDIAVEILRESKAPISLDVVVDRMKTRGVIFKSKEPAGSLCVQLTAKKAAVVVSRVGNKGMWTVPGCRSGDTLSSQEKTLASANPAALTEAAREQRRALLIQLNSKLTE